jgi:uncharacterized protein YecT (DUF1311 family)
MSNVSFHMKPLLVLVLVLLVAPQSWANERAIKAMAKSDRGFTEEEIRAELKKGCDGTGDMPLCAWYSYYTKDVALNDTYRELMRRLVSADMKEALLKSQRAWLTYRETQCAFASGDWEGGSFRRVAIAMCWKGMTEEREKEFAAILKCEEEPCYQLHESKPTKAKR